MNKEQKNVVLETFNGTVTMSMEEVEILDKVLNAFIIELGKELDKEDKEK